MHDETPKVQDENEKVHVETPFMRDEPSKLQEEKYKSTIPFQSSPYKNPEAAASGLDHFVLLACQQIFHVTAPVCVLGELEVWLFAREWHEDIRRRVEVSQ